MAPLDQLMARYDGAIPPAELAAARQAEAAYRPAALPARLGRVTRKAEVIVPLLARAMTGLYALEGAATREALQRFGFTAQELDRHGEAAKAYAADLLAARGLEPMEAA